MRLFFADDSRQSAPTRAGLSRLVGIGGFSVDVSKLRSLEMALETLAREAGFPRNEEFKWSPGRQQWMRANLVEGARQAFFRAVLGALRAHEAVVTVVASTTDCATATRTNTHESDVTQMFLERVHIELTHRGTDGVVIVERPGGGRTDEEGFLLSCATMLQDGTAFVRHDRLALNVLASSSRYVRCLQAADVVSSACLAFIAGETNYSPPIFEEVKPLFHRNSWGLVGGTGLKLHPDGRLRNLYFWLLGDREYARENTGIGLPVAGRPFATNDGLPSVPTCLRH